MLCSLDRDDLRLQVFLQQCKVTILTEHSTRSFLFLPFPYDKSCVNKIQLTTIYKDLVVRQAVLKYSSCPFTFSSNNVSILLSTQGPYIPENQKSVINHQIYSLELQGSKKTQYLKPKIFVRFVTFFGKRKAINQLNSRSKSNSQASCAKISSKTFPIQALPAPQHYVSICSALYVTRFLTYLMFHQHD